MNKVRLFVTLSAALLIAASSSIAGDGGERHIKVKIDSAGETFDVGDMEVGETRQFFTEAGEEVVVTREDDGYTLSLDGREIELVSPGEHRLAVRLDAEKGEDGLDVLLSKVVEVGDEGENVFLVSGDDAGGDGHDVFVWHEDDAGEGGSHSLSFMVKKDVLSQVLASGVLDKLDEATRQEIIDEIEKAEGNTVVHSATRTIVIDKDDVEN